MDYVSIPFGYVLRYILEFVGSYGLAIILFTILTKLLILPLAIKSKSAMIDVQRIQPKLRELQKKCGSDKQKYQQEMDKLYKAEGVNPAGSCLPTLITFPIMIGLYYVITRPLSYLMGLTPLQISQVAQRLGMDMSKIIGAHLNMIEINVANALQGSLSKVADISPRIFEIHFNFLGLNLAATAAMESCQPGLFHCFADRSRPFRAYRFFDEQNNDEDAGKDFRRTDAGRAKCSDDDVYDAADVCLVCLYVSDRRRPLLDCE